MNNYAMVHYPDGNPNPGMIFYQTAIFQVDIQNVFRYNYVLKRFFRSRSSQRRSTNGYSLELLTWRCETMHNHASKEDIIQLFTDFV